MSSLWSALAGGGLALVLSGGVGAATVSVEVQPNPVFKDIPRLGINLGEWTSWGASQYGANVLRNPGFEGTEDRALVVVESANARGFTDDTSWTGRADGFWAGGAFAVRSGAASGATGRLFDSRKKNSRGLPEFLVEDHAPPLMPGDVVMVSRKQDTGLPAYWQTNTDSETGQIKWIDDARRPNGLGQRVIELMPIGQKSARLLYWLDGLTDRAGKLIQFRGRWRLSVWAKADGAGSQVHLWFARIGGKPFLDERVPLKAGWQQIVREFQPDDGGPPVAAEVRIEAEGGTVQLDDIALASASDAGFPFRAEMVETLKRLRPGYLRDWQGQLGDGFQNRVADSFARDPSRYRPGPEERYFYGLADFLLLCRKVGANPWIILPTTLVDEEYVALGRWLAEWQKRQPFPEWVIEFGNENWNAIFRPAGLMQPAQLGPVASRAFTKVAEGAGSLPLRFTIGGQHVNPRAALKVLDAVPQAESLAMAPYLMQELNQADFQSASWSLLFRPDPFLSEAARGVAERKKSLSVYEVNFHTTRGDAPLDLRNKVVAGAASGPALAQRLLEAMALGVRRQCVYSLAQFDTALPDNGGFLKLWGVARDLGVTGLLRPAGLAMAMLNQALPADVYPVKISGDDAGSLNGLAFRNPAGWQLALISGAARPVQFSVTFPDAEKPPTIFSLLDASKPSVTNEEDENVRVSRQPLAGGNPRVFTVPPWSLILLGQADATASPPAAGKPNRRKSGRH